MKHTSSIVQRRHWGKSSRKEQIVYWIKGLQYRLSRQVLQIIGAVSFVLASVSMVYAPPAVTAEKVVYITDTITEHGIIIQTDTVVRTVMGPTIFKMVAPKDDTAPFIPGEYDAEKYIKNFSAIAVGEMRKYKIPASISLAQGLIESRAGTSRLAVKANNHFGMKCFSRSCKKGHCMNATDDSHKDFFRNFRSAWESYRAHSLLISSGRYAKLKKHGKDYKKWAYGLQSAGYATDQTYAKKLISVIETHKLYRFDQH